MNIIYRISGFWGLLALLTPLAATAQTPSPQAIEEPPVKYSLSDSPSIGTPNIGPPKTATPKPPYGSTFLDNDFTVINDSEVVPRLGDALKQQSLGQWGTIDLGGEYRLRFHDENNLRSKPISGRDDEFALHRLRLFADWRLNDDVRFFAEAIDASSGGENFAPRATEVNRFDAQNLVVDARLLSDGEGNDWWVRAGRQEMILGSMRLVSHRPWRNTPQNFDGVRTWISRDDARLDAFWLMPIDVRQHAGGDSNFDRSNTSQDFFGLFATLPAGEGEVREAYYLGWNESDPSFVNFDGTTGGFSLHTFGGRVETVLTDGLTFETEGGVQFGRYAGDPHLAGFTVVGLRRSWADLPMKPQWAVYHDWASGDADFNDSRHGTFMTPAQRGHFFLGFADITGRHNIHDVNTRLTLKPHDDVALRFDFHRFWLASAHDALYNVGSGASYHAPDGSAGTDIGSEIDLTARWNITPRASLLFGYSYFWSGEFFDSPVIRGGPAGLADNGADGRDASFVYMQSTIRF